MRLEKAAGPDGVLVEAWKVPGDRGVNWLTQFLNRITKEGNGEISGETKALPPGILDLEKAYDRLPRAVLWNSLRGRSVPERLISVIKDMYEGLKAAI
ncbi:unnamed protein product [Heligmosomoides polygyrus]|uniref:Reverse transcriptase domain-containing protein n=1 Tax=Heligmosomoides polygyrus TaxID=6339 RepID=A0A183F471_HELPZ|nr:unnamed protein product [Heligmosomoides polygyrus]